MRPGRVRRLIRDLAIALGGGLLSSLIAILFMAHPALALSTGAAMCVLIALGIGRSRHRPRLAVKIRSTPQWESPNQHVRIVAVPVEVRNKTRETIRIEGVEFTYEGSAAASRNEQFDEIRGAVTQVAGSSRYFPPLSGFTEVPARGSISGWVVEPVMRDPAGGTPQCVITVKDEIGSRYKATIPAQEAHTYGA